MDRLETFNQHRPLLFAIAYRMLGTTTDAEDMLQEAWIRWQSTQTVVQSPKAFLSSIITRLCIDRLRSARVQRENYVGTWLPEPLMTESSNNTEESDELAESLSFAFLTLLECLSPIERAIFLLREVFDYDYSDIAKTVGKSIPNCRSNCSSCTSTPDSSETQHQFISSTKGGNDSTVFDQLESR